MNSLALILILPFLGFLINGLFGSRLPKALVSFIACALPAGAFAVTVANYPALCATKVPIVADLFTWAAFPGFKLEAALYFDQISAMMCLVVTGVGTLIHIYSVGYMSHDESFSRYFAYLNLFLFFMLMLVLGKNMVMLFTGWEGVGLASYLLIGFWFKDSEKTAAGMKAFIVNRVGDTAFVLAAFTIFYFAKTLDFQEINAFFATGQVSVGMLNLIGILLLVGACGKSAQIPLHVWLPDAMAGPTPVSALIHAATMVTAGVYLISRLSGVFMHAPGAMTVVAYGGAITAFIGATMGLTQYNIKKVLAYSTMSQIGLMFLACGVGAFNAGLFHLFTHAFFKACLFLGAGAVIHGLHGEEDMRYMGGLGKKLPLTFATFGIATLALSGVPPFAGFFSKDEILWSAYAGIGGGPVLWALGSAASFLTAFYMFRLVIMTFLGESRVKPEKAKGIHEGPVTMSGVLVILALFSVGIGFIGMPGALREMLHTSAPFYDFLAPALPHHEAEAANHALETTFMLISIVVAFAGIALSFLFFSVKKELAEKSKAAFGPVYDMVSQGYFFDAFYNGVIVAFMDWVSENVLARGVEPTLDANVIEAPSETVGYASRLFASLQAGNVQAYVLYVFIGLALVLLWGVVHV
ncbi:NADH-quinone oxidoreductase subunit L [Geomonas sp. RF6]|uniref:NADH-quinone oxidoreductase subunit L n=1 Tax=Geomonas sp. RF6 TaxID=2897342 RepID=UPI001E4EB77E|nr:NADH-quinone oxidoreductase subunit L [Geomonas sp. RF6]UFS72581.1 NADH-quinone oxidoreductase subunit L [Geomonas sp. RF6]